MGHEDPFPRPRLGGCCRFSEGSFVGTGSNGRDAPIADIPALTAGTGRFYPFRTYEIEMSAMPGPSGECRFGKMTSCPGPFVKMKLGLGFVL
jgi:hypothetical protein